MLATISYAVALVISKKSEIENTCSETTPPTKTVRIDPSCK